MQSRDSSSSSLLDGTVKSSGFLTLLYKLRIQQQTTEVPNKDSSESRQIYGYMECAVQPSAIRLTESFLPFLYSVAFLKTHLLVLFSLNYFILLYCVYNYMSQLSSVKSHLFL